MDMKLGFVVVREEDGAISGSHGGDYEAGCVLGCCAV
jgi:hypothetical protein